MFKINPDNNSIRPLGATSFSDLGFSERKHLQEWLANYPKALVRNEDDELMIIQKEFDGFKDTRERLDLLAIDQGGNLVIIENKLDDSGRDVVWQALKYASYCSTLKKQEVVEIFQRYLNQQAQAEGGEPENAEKKLLEFLQVDDLESAQINTHKSQRLILVAAKYRKEVTSTVLWLSQFGIECQCFKVTPWRSGNELLLNVEQIIPTPEAADFMIGMMAKESEEKSASDILKTRHKLRLEFWEQTLGKFHESRCNLFDSIGPGKENWLAAGSGISGMSYNLIFGKNEVRVEFYMGRSQAEVNKHVYDRLEGQKEAIEAVFGDELVWEPLPNRKACRIHYAENADGFNKENWPTLQDWLLEHMLKLEQALSKSLEKIKPELRRLELQHATANSP